MSRNQVKSTVYRYLLECSLSATGTRFQNEILLQVIEILVSQCAIFRLEDGSSMVQPRQSLPDVLSKLFPVLPLAPIVPDEAVEVEDEGAGRLDLLGRLGGADLLMERAKKKSEDFVSRRILCEA